MTTEEFSTVGGYLLRLERSRPTGGARIAWIAISAWAFGALMTLWAIALVG